MLRSIRAKTVQPASIWLTHTSATAHLATMVSTARASTILAAQNPAFMALASEWTPRPTNASATRATQAPTVSSWSILARHSLARTKARVFRSTCRMCASVRLEWQAPIASSLSTIAHRSLVSIMVCVFSHRLASIRASVWPDTLAKDASRRLVLALPVFAKMEALVWIVQLVRLDMFANVYLDSLVSYHHLVVL